MFILEMKWNLFKKKRLDKEGKQNMKDEEKTNKILDINLTTSIIT